MKRLFIAIKIKPEQQLLNVYNEIKKTCFLSKIKWVNSDLFHITLKFLGDTNEEKIPVIKDVMDKTVSGYKPFEFDIKGIGIFGSSYRPRVIWLGIENREKLEQLGNTLMTNMDRNGFIIDRQNFIPHLTVGRIKYIQNKKALQQIVNKHKEVFLQKVEVKSIILYESVLKREGPQYFPLYKVSITE